VKKKRPVNVSTSTCATKPKKSSGMSYESCTRAFTHTLPHTHTHSLTHTHTPTRTHTHTYIHTHTWIQLELFLVSLVKKRSSINEGASTSTCVAKSKKSSGMSYESCSLIHIHTCTCTHTHTQTHTHTHTHTHAWIQLELFLVSLVKKRSSVNEGASTSTGHPCCKKNSKYYPFYNIGYSKTLLC